MPRTDDINVEIRVLGPKGSTTVTCLADTGYSGDLLLPRAVLAEVGLHCRLGPAIARGVAGAVAGDYYLAVLPDLSSSPVGEGRRVAKVFVPYNCELERMLHHRVVGRGVLSASCVVGGTPGRVLWRDGPCARECDGGRTCAHDPIRRGEVSKLSAAEPIVPGTAPVLDA